MMSAEAAQVARRAAEIIQERGIAKGAMSDAEGHVCALGAIARVSTEYLIEGAEKSFDDFAPLQNAVTAELNAATFAEFGLCYMAWNDLPETDERDVAKVLLMVADRLEIGE